MSAKGARRTQRAWARYYDDPPYLYEVTCKDSPERVLPVPVLVVPEEAVTKCKHNEPLREGEPLGWCHVCGACLIRGRWQRPRILRVGRKAS